MIEQVAPQQITPELNTHNRFRWLAKQVFGTAIKTVCPLEIEGIGNVPEDEPYILASNHERKRDPLLLSYALYPAVVRFLAGETWYENPATAWALDHLDAIKVDPCNSTRAELRELDKLVSSVFEAKQALGIFRYGTRERYVKPGDAPKQGIGFFAVRHTVPVIPAAIMYEGNRGHIRFGEPVPADGKRDAINERVNTEIENLLGRSSIASPEVILI